jgi:hypothetical protein
VTAFFIPGVTGERHVIEREYDNLRQQTELETGRRPSSRRILSIWARRGSVDCVTQVGERDPVRGGTVLAIFDLGSRQPFVVWWRKSPGSDGGVQEVLDSSAYSVLDFDQ